jgi:hypothetical protein
VSLAFGSHQLVSIEEEEGIWGGRGIAAVDQVALTEGRTFADERRARVRVPSKRRRLQRWRGFAREGTSEMVVWAEGGFSLEL